MSNFCRTESKLLSEISWHTNVILGHQDPEDEDLYDFSRRVSEAEQELSGMSADVKVARKVLGIEPGPIGSINEAHLYKAVNRVLAYRILDVCQWVRSEHSSLKNMAAPTLIGDHNNLLQKLKAQKMQNWPDVLTRAKGSLQSILSVDSNSTASDPSIDPTQRLLNSVIQIKKQNKGHKWLSNFEIAAMHLSGHWDVVGSQFELAVQRQIQGSSQKRMSCLRNPLNIALALSPIALLQDKLMWTVSAASKFVLESLQVFSGNKPQMILEIEHELWSALIDVAKGKEETLPRLHGALSRIEERIQQESFTDISEWFGDREELARQEFIGPSHTPSTIHTNDKENTHPDNTQTQKDAPMAASPGTQIQAEDNGSPLISAHNSIKSPMHSSQTDDDLSESSSARSTKTPQADDIQGRKKEAQHRREEAHKRPEEQEHQAPKLTVVERAKGKDRQHTNKKRSTSLQRKEREHHRRPHKKRHSREQEQESDDEEEQDKEEKEEKPQEEAIPEIVTLRDLSLTVSLPRFVNRRTVLNVTPIISVQQEREPASKHTAPYLTDPVGYKTIRGHRQVQFMGPSGLTELYTPQYHIPSELHTFYELFGHASTAQGHRDIQVLSNEQVTKPSSQDIFGYRHLVVENAPFQTYPFNSFGLGRLFGSHSALLFIDHTQETEKTARGTIHHLLDSDKALNGNIISMRRVSMTPSDFPPPESLASDVNAWNCTAEESYCKRRIHFPEQATRWITAATRNAFGPWTEEAHGFCTYINILNGQLWVLIAKPKTQTFAHVSNIAISFDPMATNSGLWDIEGVFLAQGSQLILRPNTPYRVLTIQSSIYAGGLFYSTSSITQSCIGLLQSFISASTPYEPHLFKASRLLLARMLIHIHQQFVLDAIMETSPSEDSPVNLVHLPDLGTMGGILAVLSLINVAELANVLHPDTYQAGVHPEERMFLIHVRKLGRHTLHWLNNHYVLLPAHHAGSVISTTNGTPHLAHSYLLHQAGALQEAKMCIEKAGLRSAVPGLTYQALYIQVVGCVGRQANEAQGHAKTFAWDQDSHQVSRRSVPLLTRFDGTGETLDDRNWIQMGKSLRKH